MNDNWRYQVWVHNLLEKRVFLWDTYDNRKRAEDEALSMNVIQQHDTPDGATVNELFIVRPIAVRDLVKPRGNAYKRLVEDGVESYMSRYKGELLPYSEHIVQGVLAEVNSCATHKMYLMEEEGGLLSWEGENFDGIVSTAGFIVYHGNNRISFEVAFTRGARYVSRIVKVFKCTSDIVTWLMETETAAKASEGRLIEMLCDRHYGLLDLLDQESER